MIGAKHAAVCRWIFTLLGAGPGDSLDDLFPGSGAISRAWAAYTGQQPSPPPAVYASYKAPGRRASRPRATVLTRRVRPWTTAICFRWNLPGDRPHRVGDGPRPPGQAPA